MMSEGVAGFQEYAIVRDDVFCTPVSDEDAVVGAREYLVAEQD